MRLGVAAALVGGELVAGDVSVEDGRIEGVGLAGAGTGLAVPGFVDVQVNGFAGRRLPRRVAGRLRAPPPRRSPRPA